MPGTNLTIMMYDTATGGDPTKSKDEYTVDFNPNTFTIDNAVNYQATEVIGQAGGDPVFQHIPPINFSIDFTIDGTGVTKPGLSASEQKDYVKKSIEHLRKVTGSEMNGKIHRTNYLAVRWGNIHINCVLSKIQIVYNLFDREGTPLRAKVTCSFLERSFPGETERKTRLESADLTKYRYIKEGDILPLIARENYDDSSYYLQVAKVNKLKSFRNISPGSQLVLPPMEDNNE